MIPVLMALAVAAAPVHAARVKDISELYGVRENPLVGSGLVVGLDRTGDSSQNAAAVRTLANRLAALGFTMSEDDIKSRNVAMVMVTATLPPGARPGSRMDVSVSSVGDARSLEGGTLLLTPMVAANGMQVATAQGAITVGGYSVQNGGDLVVKNHPTVGVVSRGATLEVELPNQLNFAETVDFQFVLHEPDFTNATALASAFNTVLAGEYARPLDGGTVRVSVPDDYLGRQPELVALLEAQTIALDHPARVVVNERTGTVVMGANITVSPVAVAHGGLTIEVHQQFTASQPNMLAGGETTVLKNTEVEVNEADGRVSLLAGATVGDVVGALNAMGVSPRDLIVILQAMREAGGLHAEIVSQ